METLHAMLDPASQTLVLRDFHSPNIIWCDGQTPVDRTGLIDFQDALIGPPAYDVMSLAEDARVDVDEGLRQAIVAAYCEARQLDDPTFSPDDFAREAAIVAAQRACKILGIFVRLDLRDGKPAYRAHLPRVRGTLDRAITHPALGELRRWLIDNRVIDA
jgi:aminoglycoside/choline kinase family phosphotransferase